MSGDDATDADKLLRARSELTLSELAALYSCAPINEAAKQLGIGLTALKRRCRELGIKRWPYRQLHSIDNMILSLRDMSHLAGVQVLLLDCISSAQLCEQRALKARLLRTASPKPCWHQEAIDNLLSQKALLMENPSLTIPDDLKKLRQAQFKEKHNSNRATRTADAPGNTH